MAKNKPTDDKINTINRGESGEREATKAGGLKPEHAGAPKEIPGGPGRENQLRQGDSVKGNRRQQDKSQGKPT